MQLATQAANRISGFNYYVGNLTGVALKTGDNQIGVPDSGNQGATINTSSPIQATYAVSVTDQSSNSGQLVFGYCRKKSEILAGASPPYWCNYGTTADPHTAPYCCSVISFTSSNQVTSLNSGGGYTYLGGGNWQSDPDGTPANNFTQQNIINAARVQLSTKSSSNPILSVFNVLGVRTTDLHNAYATAHFDYNRMDLSRNQGAPYQVIDADWQPASAGGTMMILATPTPTTAPTAVPTSPPTQVPTSPPTPNPTPIIITPTPRPSLGPTAGPSATPPP